MKHSEENSLMEVSTSPAFQCIETVNMHNLVLIIILLFKIIIHSYGSYYNNLSTYVNNTLTMIFYYSSVLLFYVKKTITKQYNYISDYFFTNVMNRYTLLNISCMKRRNIDQLILNSNTAGFPTRTYPTGSRCNAQE